MAIQPNIALQYKQPEPMNISQYAQLANLAAQNAQIRQAIESSMTQQRLTEAQIPGAEAQARLTEAQIPGVQAESAVKQRAVSFNKFLDDNAQNFVNPATGKVDFTRVLDAAAAKGFLKESEQLFQEQLTTDRKRIDNARADQDRSLLLNDAVNKHANHISVMTHSLRTPEEKLSAINKYVATMEKILPGTGKLVKDQFVTVDPATGKETVDVNKLDATRTATMSVSELERMRADFAQKFYTDEGRNPNSTISKNLRAFAKEAGVELPENISAFEIRSNPIYNDIVQKFAENQLVSPEIRATARVGELETRSNIEKIDKAIQAGKTLSKDFLPTKLGTIGSARFQQLVSQNKELAAYVAAAQIHNALNPDAQIDFATMSIGEGLAILEQTRKSLESKAKAQETVSKETVLPRPTTRKQPSLFKLGTTKEEGIADLKAIRNQILDGMKDLKPGSPSYTRAMEDLKANEAELKRMGVTDLQSTPAPAPAPAAAKPEKSEAGKTYTLKSVREFAKRSGYSETDVIKQIEAAGGKVK